MLPLYPRKGMVCKKVDGQQTPFAFPKEQSRYQTSSKSASVINRAVGPRNGGTMRFYDAAGHVIRRVLRFVARGTHCAAGSLCRFRNRALRDTRNRSDRARSPLKLIERTVRALLQ